MMTIIRKKTGMPNPTDRHVGSRVRLRRVMLNLNQTDLASRLGLSYQQVQKYETGTNRIGASRLQQISHILKVPVAFFFEGAPGLTQSRTRRNERPLPDYVIEFLSTSDGVALAKAFTRMRNIKLRRRIVRLAVEIMGKI
jgi:transcriptional regulator with XRE-family HTH domain